MKIFLFTHNYPLVSGGEDRFLQTEMDYLAKNLDKFHISEVVIVPTSGPMQYASEISFPNADIFVDFSVLRTRHRIRRFRKLKVLVFSLLKSWRLLERNSSRLRNLRQDFLTLLTWSDNYLVMMQTLKDSSFRKQLDGAVLYTYWTDGYTAALGTYLTSSGRNINSLLVSRAHGGDVLEEQLLQVNLKRRCNSTDQIYTTSPLLSEHLRNHGVSDDKLTVAQLGVEINSNMSNTSEKYDLELPRFNVGNQTLLVTVSSNHPVKRLSRLQQTLSATELVTQPIYWLHIGAILPPLKSPMSDFDMHSLGHLSHRQVFSTLTMLLEFRPVFLNFSQSEGVPISLVEAALMGIPCIGTRVGGTPFLIENQKSGILIDVDSSPQILSSAIDYVCANYDELARSIQSKASILYHPNTAFSLFYGSLYERWSSKVGDLGSIRASETRLDD